MRDWLAKNLKDRGYGARTELADFLGLRPEAISRMLSEDPTKQTREITADELLRMAEFFGTTPPLAGFEEDTTPFRGEHLIPIMGYVGAGSEIEPDYEQVPHDGLDQIELPYPVSDGLIGFQIRGDSQMPKYEDGEILIVERDQPIATDRLVGDMAVVRTSDGRRMVKRIMPGPKPHTFNLESHNARTIIGARIAWASPVRMVIPNVGLRSARKPKRPHGRSRAQAAAKEKRR